MNTRNPHYAQVLVAIVALTVFMATPVFGTDRGVDNSEVQATVERMVVGMIADTMKKGYRQPPVSIVLVACTYGETGKRSEYSIWLEATIKQVLLEQSGLGVMAKGVAEDLEAPQRENYLAFSKRIQADWMLRGSFVGEGSQIRVTLELVDLATSQVLMQRSLTTGKVYSPEGRTLALMPSEDPGTQAPSAPVTTWVLIQVPEGMRADLKILDILGQKVKQYPDSEGEQVKLAPGRYRLEAVDRLGQYYPYVQDFEVAQARVRLEVSLKPRFGSLELRVKPALGVEVAINGRKEEATGSGLWVLEGLMAGKYEVVATKEMYRAEKREVEIKEGERTQVELVLEENKYRLEVTGGGGIGGKVIVDGMVWGNLPVSRELPFGKVRVRVEPADSRFRVWEKDVEPKVAGGIERVSVEFKERTGTVEITTSPAVEAALRARELGGTWRGIGSAPMDWPAMVGEYEVEGQAVIKGQERSGVERVTIREGQVTQMRIQLTTTSTTSTTTTTTIASLVSMVRVPGGSFQMGSPSGGGNDDERPVHTVNLTGFLMSKYEVTQEQYRIVTGSSPSSFRGTDLPVENVSWYDAVEFCNKLSEMEGLQKVYTITARSPATGYPITSASVMMDMTRNGYRLPTEAEWEYAARGGNGSPGNYLYSGSNEINKVAWYSENSDQKTHAVGTRNQNALGLYDMSGNVWEWCWDWKGVYSIGAQTDPVGAVSDTYRVGRGGSWGRDAVYCRSAYRYAGSPGSRYNSIGFRLTRRP